MTPNLSRSGKPLVLVTGATGYIGGRLVPRLLGAGYRVRCLVREAARLQGRRWLEHVEVAVGDALDANSLHAALEGVSVAYYLIHSLRGGSQYARRDLQAARNFGSAAKQARVDHIIYLGGLGAPGASLSNHLRSRQETGAALRESGIPVTEFRAGVIVGPGSLSFEIVRYLTERLPVMICPSWVYTRVQPIAVRNVLDYLLASLRTPEATGRVIEIGGAGVLTYGEMIAQYAQVRGLRRWLIPVPVLTPRLSSYWVHWITPIPAAIARPLIDGLRSEVVVRDDSARKLFPAIEPIDYRAAVAVALEKLEAGAVETTWTDALSSALQEPKPVTLSTSEGMIIERRTLSVNASAHGLFSAFTSLGGNRGWLFMNWAWKIRGWIDRLAGGVGLRRGRRDPVELRTGDALDFWRVEALEPDRLLRLRAEMKVPGKAWLQFEVAPAEPLTFQILIQTAFFAPKGLAGLAYWYLLYPIHALIFRGLIRRIAAAAKRTTPPGDRTALHA